MIPIEWQAPRIQAREPVRLAVPDPPLVTRPAVVVVAVPEFGIPEVLRPLRLPLQPARPGF